MKLYLSDFYYKLLWEEDSQQVTIVCMQDFDESDYDSQLFVKDKSGDICKFSEENEARTWMSKNIKREFIDPQCRTIPDDIYMD